jgi:hypothetical protein
VILRNINEKFNTGHDLFRDLCGGWCCLKRHARHMW